jgi:hypothetical protein
MTARCLHQELGFGSGMTCWRRLLDWTDAGVRQRLHDVLLGKLRAAEQLNMSRAVIDGTYIRSLRSDPRAVRARPTAAKPLSASPSTDRTSDKGHPSSAYGLMHS